VARVTEQYHEKRSNKLQAALAYADQGVPVFPCVPGGKRPLTKNGFKNATTDAAVISEWWTEHPDANIGLPTGRRSGVWVLDVDPDRGGLKSLKMLESRNGSLGEATVRTGGGGLHYYFKYSGVGEVRSSAGKVGPGLDVRGAGGYVVVPPSVTTNPYERLEGRQSW
jgi:putative DNA primase/helicase